VLAKGMDRRVRPGDDDLQISRPTSSPFALPFSQLQLFFRSLPLREGRAERRWRLDACDAPRSARHDRRADASSNEQARANARLAFIAHHREPVAAFDMRNPDQPVRLALRRLA